MTAAPEAGVDLVAEARRQWESRGWTEAAEGMAVVTSVMRVQQILLARVDEVLRPMSLTFARYELLVLLSFTAGGSMPLGRLGRLLQVHPTSVTSAVDRLEAGALVRRSGDPADRRTVLAVLTPAGRALAVEATERLNTEVFSALGVPRPGELLDALTDLRRAAGDF